MPRNEEPSGRLDAANVRTTDAARLARLRNLHLEMIAAIIAGGGLERLVQLASGEVNGTVAIFVPRLGEAAAPAGALRPKELSLLRRYVQSRVAKRPADLPDGVA